MIRAIVLAAGLSATAAAGGLGGKPTLSLPKPRQAEIFVRALGAKQPTVRRVALEHLAELGDQAATHAAAPAIAAIALDDKQAVETRQAALSALLAMPGEPAVESLWPLMKAVQPDRLTGFAAVTLAKHVDAAGAANHVSPGKLAAYLLVWIKVPDDFTAEAAAEALGALGARVLPDLRAMLPGASRAQLRGIARALATMKSTAAPALPDLYAALDTTTGSLERRELVDAIEQIEGKPSLKVRLKALGKPGDRLAVYDVESAAEKLGPAAHEAFEPLLRQLGPDTAATTFRALEFLIVPADFARVAKAAAPYVDANADYTRSSAISLLAKSGEPGRKILEGVLDGGSVRSRIDTLRELDKLGDQLARVTALLKAQDAKLRRDVLYAISTYGARAEQPLLAAFADKDPDARIAAVRGLGKVRTQLALDALVKALGDSDKNLRDAAAYSIADLGPFAVGAAGAIVAADAKFPLMSGTQAIVKLGPGAIPALRAIAGDPKADERKHIKAAEALGSLEADAAVPELVALLDGKHSQQERFYAALALSQIAAKRTLPDMESALLDDDATVREVAARTVGELGGPSSDAARRILVGFIAHADPAAELAIGTLIAHGVAPDLLPHLRKLAGTASTTSMARTAAVKALVAANDRSPATLTVLRTAMTKDESIYVREPAAEALLAMGTEADLVAALVVIDGADDQRFKEDAAVMRSIPQLSEP